MSKHSILDNKIQEAFMAGMIRAHYSCKFTDSAIKNYRIMEHEYKKWIKDCRKGNKNVTRKSRSN